MPKHDHETEGHSSFFHDPALRIYEGQVTGVEGDGCEKWKANRTNNVP